MSYYWNSTPTSRLANRVDGGVVIRKTTAAERRAACDLLDECDEVARDMASAWIDRRVAAGNPA